MIKIKEEGKGRNVVSPLKGMRLEGERTNRSTEGASVHSRFCSSKGQMFIIASIIILIGLIMLKNMLGIYTTVEEKRYQETTILDKQLRNIKSEYERIIGIASLSSESSGIDHLSNFSSLIPGKVLYLFIWVNGSEFNVSISNFIGDKINCTLSATDSSPSEYFIGTLNHGEYATREFQALSSESNITLSYDKQGSRIIETIQIDISESTIGFFDIILEKKDMLVRTKDTYKVMRL